MKKHEREDFTSPESPKPPKLTEGEQKAVHREWKLGADKFRLAHYFKTDIAEIDDAIRMREIVEPRNRK